MIQGPYYKITCDSEGCKSKLIIDAKSTTKPADVFKKSSWTVKNKKHFCTFACSYDYDLAEFLENEIENHKNL